MPPNNNGGLSLAGGAAVGLGVATAITAVGILLWGPVDQHLDVVDDAFEKKEDEDENAEGGEREEQDASIVGSIKRWFGVFWSGSSSGAARSLRVTPTQSASETAEMHTKFFPAACDYVTKNIGKFSNEQRLYFYGCYKQAVVGDYDGESEAAGIFSLPSKESQKHEAWKAFSGVPSETAKALYVDRLIRLEPTVQELLDKHAAASGDGGFSSVNSCSPGFASAVSSTLGTLEGVDDILLMDNARSLLDAVNGQDVEVVTRILKESTNLTEVLNAPMAADGSTLLHLASDRGGAEMIRCLVAAGALVDACEGNGETPLHFAVMAERHGAVETLLALGADPEIRNSDGKNCIDVAREVKNVEIEKLLRNASEKDKRDAQQQAPAVSATASPQDGSLQEWEVVPPKH